MAPTPQNVAQVIPCSTVQQLVASSGNLEPNTIPSHYAFFNNPNDSLALPGDGIPIIDFSLLISDDLNQRSQCVDDLGKACKDWGFFLVYMHVFLV